MQYSVQDIDDAIFFVSFVRLRCDFETFVFVARLTLKEIFDKGKNAQIIVTFLYFVRIIVVQGRIPVKWTAYEALTRGRYTTKSDV